MARTLIDITGNKYGRLSVIKRNPCNTPGNKPQWDCVCECGNHIVVSGDNLKSGNTLSCGCLKKEVFTNKTHGMSKSRLYGIYAGMLKRCYNPNAKSYKDYGGRGITVCDEWLGKHGFENFCDWALENGYSDSLSIDRKEVNGNYEPSNCRFADKLTQSNNTRSNVYYEYLGERHTLADWARIKEINYMTLYSRIAAGMEFEKAIEIELQERPFTKIGE